MRIANEYNHLNALEYLIVRKEALYHEIIDCITCVNANHFQKISADKSRLGEVIYDQVGINSAIKENMSNFLWDDKRIDYFVTDEEETTRELINIHDRDEQRRILGEKGLPAYSTYNQVDFQKDRVAVEVQLGKYFSVTYDLHVKHTFFYSRNDIDVGIEIIPTKAI